MGTLCLRTLPLPRSYGSLAVTTRVSRWRYSGMPELWVTETQPWGSTSNTFWPRSSSTSFRSFSWGTMSSLVCLSGFFTLASSIWSTSSSARLSVSSSSISPTVF